MTKADRWKAVEALFHRALDVAPEERDAFLQAEAGHDPDLIREVQSLIQSDMANSATSSVAAEAVKKALVSFHSEEVAATAPGRRIGKYKLIREIGRGGMGSVYLATRADDAYDKRVAIKLVRRGMDTDFILSRFRRERQILASLEHPNIARLLDGGATDDGLPYLVMEYVQGVSITNYVRTHDLDIEQRLRLFLQVCDAVEYAHGNFVIHRDLKPGNILVDEKGTPKLLDFGISKLLVFDGSNITQTITQGVRMMTPDYASPEQIRGDAITASADIYSLGAILFELLTDAKPHHFEGSTPQAVEQTILEKEVPRPSQVARSAARETTARRLAGDLDNIILFALRKDPRRRYASAHLLAADIRAHLECLPISARSDTVGYRASKFVRRNWGLLAAVASVALAMLAGIWMAQREARIARMHFNQVRQLAKTFITDVHDEIRDLPGSTRARAMIVKTGLEYLEALAAGAEGDIDLQRELGAGYLRIGEVQGSVLEANLGDPRGALDSYTKALRLLEQVAQARPNALDVQADMLTIYRRMGELNSYTKSTDAALRSYAHARAVGETLLAKKPDDYALRRTVADVYQAQSLALRLNEDPAGALDAADRAVELYRSVLQQREKDAVLRRSIATTLSSGGMALARLDRREEALGRYRDGLRELERLIRDDPDNNNLKRSLMLAYSHIGDVLSEPTATGPGQTTEALQAYLRMNAIAEELQKADPVNFRALTDRGIATMRVANALQQPSEKLRRYQQALGYLQQAAKTSNDRMLQMNTAFIQTRIGDILRAGGKTADANRYYREAIPVGEQLLEADGKNSSVRRTLIEGLRWVGEDAARRRALTDAAECREKLLNLAEQVKQQRGVPPRTQALVPKAQLAAASIFEASGESASARIRYRLAIDEFRRLQKMPGFNAWKELQEAEAALARVPEHAR